MVAATARLPWNALLPLGAALRKCQGTNGRNGHHLPGCHKKTDKDHQTRKECRCKRDDQMEPGLGKSLQNTAQNQWYNPLCHDAAKHKAHRQGGQKDIPHPVVHEPFQLAGRGSNGFEQTVKLNILCNRNRIDVIDNQEPVQHKKEDHGQGGSHILK